MMNPRWIKTALIGSVCFLVFGIVFALIGGEQIQKGKTEEEAKEWLILASIGFNGFLVISITLWLNELVSRWKENKDFYDCITPIFWLVITNIYGAYYFSIKRIRN